MSKNSIVGLVLELSLISSPFHLQRGSRQSCSLSPLLQPLAQVIWSNPRKHGYGTNDTTSKISLYADDILLYITKPQWIIPTVLDTIRHFGTFSGYRIN